MATAPCLRCTSYPDVRVLVLRMLDAGASGYVLKNAAITEIIRAIRTVAAGQRYLRS